MRQYAAVFVVGFVASCVLREFAGVTPASASWWGVMVPFSMLVAATAARLENRQEAGRP